MNQSLFASMMNNTSKSAINPDVMIDIDLIDPYPFNEVLSPQKEDEQLFESLVDDIREYGLEQTIELRDMKNGRYQSLGGNRRCAAIRYLVNQENPQDLRFVKASVAPDSDLEAKRVCIASNNYGEKSEYSNLQEIKSYRKLSETQVNTYQTILNKGDETLIELIKDGSVSLESAKQVALKSPAPERITKRISSLTKGLKALSKNLEELDDSSLKDLLIKIKDCEVILYEVKERTGSQSLTTYKSMNLNKNKSIYNNDEAKDKESSLVYSDFSEMMEYAEKTQGKR